MYHILSPNSVYDIANETKIEVSLAKGKERFDTESFLDDISSWMDKHRSIVSENYLPFSFLSVGTLPVQISAFMFGIFVGKALEKHGLKIKLDKESVSKDEIMKHLEDKLGKDGLSSENNKEK